MNRSSCERRHRALHDRAFHRRQSIVERQAAGSSESERSTAAEIQSVGG